jgi:hypothetical protein
MDKRHWLRKNSATEKLRDFIEGGNEPTVYEIAEFLRGNTNMKAVSNARRAIHNLRKYYLKRGQVLMGYPAEESKGNKPFYRYKLCDKGSEVLSSLEKNERQVIGSYRNLLVKDQILNIDYKDDKESISSARKLILTLQKQIIDDELLLLYKAKNDD